MTILMSLLLLLAGIGLLILIHICFVARRFRRARANYNNNNDDNDNNNNGVAERGSLASSTMSREDIEKLPSFRYTDNIITIKNNNINEDKLRRNVIGNPKDCAVCLENLKVGDMCRLIPFCKHSFHADCVDVWLLKSTKCPICRASAESSNRDLHFDEEILVFQNNEIIIVEETENNNNNQETIVPIQLSEIQEVEDQHQHQDGRISGEISIEITDEDSNDSINKATV